MQVSDVAIAYSTCDRPELTKRTFEPLFESGCGVLWLDGSKTDEGKKLFERNCASASIGAESLYGGSYRAIIYGLTKLLEHPKKYPFIGLLENDNLLDPGWLPRIMEFFDLSIVGAVSARTLTPHILFEMTDRAIMYHLGGGNSIFRRECAELVLNTWRSISSREVRHTFLSLSGKDRLQDVDSMRSICGADFTWDTVLARHGWITMAPMPTMCRNIDGFPMERAEEQGKDEWQGADLYAQTVKMLRPPINMAVAINEERVWFAQPNHIPSGSYSNGWALEPFYPRGVHGLNYVTVLPNASIAIGYCGTDCALFVAHDDMDAAKFRFALDGRTLEFEFGKDVRMQRAVAHPQYGYHEVILTSPTPGMLFFGAAFSDHQLWFDYPETPFSFHTLPELRI